MAWFPLRRQKLSARKKSKEQKTELYEKSLLVHQLWVERRKEDVAKTVAPIAKACQERLEALGGFPLSDEMHQASKKMNSPPVLTTEFMLPESRGPHPVKILDHVLPAEWCQRLIETMESVGFDRAPTLQEIRYQDSPEAAASIAHESPRLNTSELVQVESQEFADYLWRHIHPYLPETQRSVPTEALLRPLASMGGPNSIYEKRGIIPIFRFMRYRPGQGFKAHVDPVRYYSQYPIDSHNKQGQAAKLGQDGIFRSIFTIAMYLNDPAEFNGGELNFVKEKGNFEEIAGAQDNRNDSYRSLETIVPAVGRAAIFRHDELHEGGGVVSGTKYM
ncbi:MAG: hypothetical protein SGILL_009647, partial [Bacillariaceae sp.]